MIRLKFEIVSYKPVSVESTHYESNYEMKVLSILISVTPLYI